MALMGLPVAMLESAGDRGPAGRFPGEPRVIEEMLRRLVHGPWAGRDVKMRARTKDGAFKVGLITMAKASGSTE